jgi:hypothetical protein
MLQGNGINEYVAAIAVLIRCHRTGHGHRRTLPNPLHCKWIHHVTERVMTEARQRMKLALTGELALKGRLLARRR